MSSKREPWSHQIVNYLVSALLSGAFAALAARRAGGFFPQWAGDTKAEAVALAAQGVTIWDYVWVGIAIVLGLFSLSCAVGSLNALRRAYLAGFQSHDNEMR